MNDNKTLVNYTRTDQLKAAYALNMCTVSVSQIVDYNDAYILEQEYDAILNNLNMENMPKDEALLKILVELLNTITFFRIQEIKKEQIEKKYQDRMKNAIWSAIPNLGVIVTGGNPIAIGAALATQVGAGYMNYRREKAQATREKEDSAIELRVAAIEQFNALRRELFTTAWRLSTEYKFPENYRLTERQIEQYNNILMDPDDYRQYARLEAIKDNFLAYPPFWYFLGHAACYIAQTSKMPETRKEYFEKAKKWYERYGYFNKFSILREDQMAASWALEYIDLIIVNNQEKSADKNLNLTNQEKNKISKLLSVAVRNAGNRFDVLQLCSITYLRIDDTDNAIKYLKMLVNEGYNSTINGQILSGIYARNRDCAEYEMLTMRVPERYLFPMPSKDTDEMRDLSESFIKQQRRVLKEKVKVVLRGTVDKYTEDFNRKISVFDLNKSYEQSFFANTKRARRTRNNEVKSLFFDAEKSRRYLERIKTLSLPVIYTDILEDMFTKLYEFEAFRDIDFQASITSIIHKQIEEHKDEINRLQDKLNNYNFTALDYVVLQNFDVMKFVSEAFEKMFSKACSYIENTDAGCLMEIEGDLIKLCTKLSIPDPEIMLERRGSEDADMEHRERLFDVSAFGARAIIAKQNATFLSELTEFAKKTLEKERTPNIQKYFRNDTNHSFSTYFADSIFENYPDLEAHSFAVLQNTKDQFDLIFTTEGIVYVQKGKVGKKVPYENIKMKGGTLDLWGKRFKISDIDTNATNALYEFIETLNGRFINNSQDKIEYFADLSPAIANAWFRENKLAMNSDVGRVYAWPTAQNLQAFHFAMDREYDPEHYLLQLYYDTKSGHILGMRILEFERINQKFAKELDEANGIVRVEVVS